MCTIMTFDYESFFRNQSDILDRIYDDSLTNSDGWSLVLADGEQVTCRLQSMSLDVIITTLLKSEWDRFWLHARYATGGGVNLLNTHGFDANGFIIMHNGVLRDRAADSHKVDSFLIKDFLQIDHSYALEKLLDESYANVFLIDTKTMEYYVHRSEVGSLHTDGSGNYSTNSIANVCADVVPEMYQESYYVGYENYDPLEDSEYLESEVNLGYIKEYSSKDYIYDRWAIESDSLYKESMTDQERYDTDVWYGSFDSKKRSA